MPSSLLVALQLAAMVAAVLPAGAASWHPAGYVPLAAAVGIGAWTLLHNRPGNFGIFPEPRVRARLVTTGPYALVRHPMYLAVLHVKASREERLLAQKFPEYRDYAARTARIIPGLR